VKTQRNFEANNDFRIAYNCFSLGS